MNTGNKIITIISKKSYHIIMIAYLSYLSLKKIF